ncbi:MAG: type III pantothenate kinase [Planctomycetota bacterium]|nr:MAG: type III pantothenate kinase [Planctomycetota bacterium]
MLSMNLGVDIGNSGVRIASIEVAPPKVIPLIRIPWSRPGSSGGPTPSGTGQPVPADDEPSADGSAQTAPSGAGYQPAESHWLAALPVDWSADRPVQWWISSVRRDATRTLLERIETAAGHQATLIQHTDLPVQVDVPNPERVGIDRLLAAWAAADCSPAGPVIVVEAGSAVTVDLVEVDENGRVRFAGGAILPGMAMMLRQMGQFADLLPFLDAETVAGELQLPGRSTEQAMLAGVTCSLLGGVQMAVENYRRRWGNSTPAVTSGGDGEAIARHLPDPVEHWPDLVMQGIRKLVTLRQRD